MSQTRLPVTGDYAACDRCSIGHRVYHHGALSFVTHGDGVPSIVAVRSRHGASEAARPYPAEAIARALDLSSRRSAVGR
jgi:hypothetical protein